MLLILLILSFINPSYEYYFRTTVPYNYNNFKSIESDNFIVSYPSSTEELFFIKDNMKKLALATSKYMEEAFKLLIIDLAYTPKTKINVILLDIYDFHNGMAYVVPEEIIYLYVNPPSSMNDLSEYQNWLWVTCVHELTHVISLSTNRSYSKLLRAVFGNIISINGLWPLNLIEGQAVYNETKYSNAGRGRSSFYHALIRTSIYENNFLKMYDLSIAPYITDKWPMGRVPYFYGYLLFEELNNTYSKDIPGKISYSNSAKIPFFPQLSFEDNTDKDVSGIWEDTIKNNLKYYEDEISNILNEKETTIKPFFENSNSYVERIPTYSPNKTLVAFYKEEPDAVNSVTIFNIATKEIIAKINAENTNSINWTNDETILFNSIRSDRTKQFYKILKYNIRTKELNILEKSNRITYFKLYKNQIYTIRAYTGINKIFLEKLKKNKLVSIKELYSSKLMARLSFLEIYNDNLIFVEKNINEEEKIKNLKNEIIYEAKGFIKYLKVYNNEIYYIDDSTGVYNIYKLNTHDRLTNTIGAILDFSFTNETNLIVSYLSSTGIRLGNIETNNFKSKNIKTNKILVDDFKEPTKQNLEIKKETDYSIFPSIFPKFWVPVARIDNDKYILGLSTFGADVSFRNFYTLYSHYDSQTKKADIDFTYTNKAFLLESYFNFSVDNKTSNYRENSFELGFELPLENNFNLFKTDYLFWGLIFEIDSEFTYQNSTNIYKKNGFSTGLYFRSYNASPAYFSYPEKGFNSKILYSKYPDFISSSNNYELDLYFNFAIPFIFQHHVLKFNNTYTYSYGGPYNFVVTDELRGMGNYMDFGKTFYALNFSYILPLFDINYAYKLVPLFLRKSHLSFTFDYARYSRNYNNFDYIYTYGLEFHTSSNVFYHVLGNFLFAYYRCPNTDDNRFVLGFTYY